MVWDESGMNPVAMTIINHREKILAMSGIKPIIACSQVLYATLNYLDLACMK